MSKIRLTKSENNEVGWMRMENGDWRGIGSLAAGSKAVLQNKRVKPH